MTQPQISIIGTIYNQRSLAERTLDIWCRQKFDRPYEIVILDDGSSDGSKEMVAVYQRQYPHLIRYYYFDAPHLVRNCTLLFNTAVRRLVRSQIVVIQWYDRIPGSFDALRQLYAPHQRQQRIFVSFLTRHIAGSSSRDTITEQQLDQLMDTVDWRSDPKQLTKIMGTPGAHCHRDTMNESACFSLQKKHFIELGGYDERYFKVANYSNIELYGRLINAGIKPHIIDQYTFHQPHESNRSDIQTIIEPDTVIRRNTKIRQDWGSILPESLIKDDACKWSFVQPNGSRPLRDMALGAGAGRIVVQGFSEFQPLVRNDSPQNRQANRRVEITMVTPDMKG